MSQFIKLSVSKTATFQSCKAKYKFSYILKMPKKEYSYHLFGRFVHRVLEIFHLAYINGSTVSYDETMSASFNEAIQEVKNKITSSQKDEAFLLLTTYLSKLPGSRDTKILSVEQTFNLPINEGLTLTGMIDRVQLDNDGIYHVLDYKTSKSAKYLKNDLLQLLTYAYIIYTEHPELTKVRVSYIMLRLDSEIITKEFELDEILSIKGIYEKYADEIHAEKEFAPNPQVLCGWCEFAEHCPAGMEVIEKRLKTGATKW